MAGFLAFEPFFSIYNRGMKLVIEIPDALISRLDGAIHGTFTTRSECIRSLVRDFIGANQMRNTAINQPSEPMVAAASVPATVERTLLSSVCTSCLMKEHDKCWQIKEACICPCGCVGKARLKAV